MSQYGDHLPQEQWEILRHRHPGGDAQIKAILASTKSFATSNDDLNFTPPLLFTIKARTFLIQGDRDPLYPVDLSLEMFKAIPNSRLWIIPNAGHGPVIGTRWSEFLQASSAFLSE
jgi:pimeloyl-ACP methyl ester carboxylesterase